MPSNIEWTDEAWNASTGCTKVSPGCAHCYAETLTKRYAGRPGWPETFVPWVPGNDTVVLHPDRLEAPLHWKTPRRVFVDSMSDLFHDDVPDEYIDRVFAVMALTPQHTYQCLTKRPERMREYCSDPETPKRVDLLKYVIEAGRLSELNAPEREQPIDGWSGYFVTSKGRILSDRTNAGRRNPESLHEVKPQLGEQGHSRVMVQFEGATDRLLIHRLVLSLFDRPPIGDEQGCHIDGDPTNNALWNLRWGDQSGNWDDSKRHGTRRRYSKLSPSDVEVIRRRSSEGESAYRIVQDFGVSDTQVRNILRGEQWKPEHMPTWPLENCWLGVTVENQRWADERIPILLDTPAAVRFVSAEPLLAPIEIDGYMMTWDGNQDSAEFVPMARPPIQWVIVGGESGSGHRPFDPEWARSIVSQCRDAGVACFVKQLGGARPGNKLDDLPEDLRVREFPR